MAKDSDKKGYSTARGNTLNCQFESQVKNYFVYCSVIRTCIYSNMLDCKKVMTFDEQKYNFSLTQLYYINNLNFPNSKMNACILLDP
jgi:hypothetical protein